MAALTQRFLEDLAALLSGRGNVEMPYLVPGIRKAIDKCLAPFFASDCRLSPNFENGGELNIAGDLAALREQGELVGVIRFTDRSEREERGGVKAGPRPPAKRSVTVELHFSRDFDAITHVGFGCVEVP